MVCDAYDDKEEDTNENEAWARKTTRTGEEEDDKDGEGEQDDEVRTVSAGKYRKHFPSWPGV